MAGYNYNPYSGNNVMAQMNGANFSMMTDAKNRLAHSQQMHKQFTSIIQTLEENGEKEKVADCLWKETHKHYVEWFENLENCIKKW